jgi:hypothetical protein
MARLLLLVFLMSATEPVFAQPTPADAEAFQARIDAAAVALGSNPRFKNLSLKYRQGLAEFVTGNMLFVVLHEMAHAGISEMDCRCLEGRKMRPIPSPPRD